MPKNKSYRKFGVTALAAAAGVATVAPFVATADTTKSFPDVKPGDSGSEKGGVGVHYDAIISLAEKGIIDGKPDGKFYPWENVTRGQVAKILVEAQGIDIPNNIESVLSVYSDVDANNAYADYIAAATKADIFKGDHGVFGEYTFISREQMGSVLVRAFNLNDIDVGQDAAVNLTNVSDSHKDSVQALANLGLTTELSDFRAYENNSRAGFSSFLKRTMDRADEDGSAVSGVESVTPTTTPAAPIDLHNGVLQNNIVVTYKQAMGSSAIDLSNYTLDGVALPDNTDISMNNDKKIVTLKLPEGFSQDPIEQRFRISSEVKTINGSPIVANETTGTEYTQKVKLADNTQPVLEKAEYLVIDMNSTTETKRIKLTFSENLTASDLSGSTFAVDDLSVVFNNAEESIAEIIDSNPGNKELIIELEDDMVVSNAATVNVIPESNDNQSMQIVDSAGNHAKAGSVNLNSKTLDDEQIQQNDLDMAAAQAIVDAATITTVDGANYTEVIYSNEDGLVWMNKHGFELDSNTESMPRQPGSDTHITVTATATINGQTAEREIEFIIPKK